MEITSVIKYEGDNSTFVWKHPCEDFNTNSQLIVHESQEAVFFLNGQPMDLFGSGRYTLETANIPILRKIKNIPSGGVSPFHCEVYELLLKTKNAYAVVLAQAKQKQEEQARHDNRQEAARAVFNSEGLTGELTDLLIDRVLVYPDNRIEIAYKIKDIFD